MLPELLRNNCLEDSALSLVKSVQNIDGIQGRLKKVYRDPKMMLSKRLSQLENVEMIQRTKSPVKIAEGLTKIISTIKDLIQLFDKCNIENKLYNSDATDKIYKITGDGRVTKFLIDNIMRIQKEKFYGKDLLHFLKKM